MCGKQGGAQWVALEKILGLGLYEAVIAIPWIMWNGFDNCLLSLLVICLVELSYYEKL